MTTTHIYGLVDPRTQEIRYIGKSIRPKERLMNHCNEPPSNCHRSHWIQELKRLGIKPDMIFLESVSGEWPWQESEKWWIKHGRDNGWPLTNNTDGGDGVEGLPPETQAKIKAAWKGRKHRPETIAKLKAARALRPFHSAETRARMSAAQKGRVITWTDKLAVAIRKFSPEQVEEIRSRITNGEGVQSIAKEFGVHRTTISKIKMGTYHERYRSNDHR
jgi:hypothetical protein